MNLLMITGDRALAAGKKGAFFNTLSELHKHFDRIDVICPHVPMRRYDMVVFENVHIHPSPWPLFLQWFWIWFMGRRIARTIHPAVMTVHEYPFTFNGVGASFLHRATGIPYILEVHHIVGYPHAAGLRERLGLALTRFLVPYTSRTAVAVRVVNRQQAPHWLRAIGIPEQKIIVIPSVYLDLTVFKPDSSVPKQYDVACVGRMTSNKGLGFFLDILEQTGLVGVAVGDGPLLSWVRREAKKRGLKLHTPGFAKDAREIAQYMNASRLLVMTSLNEGGPRVVVEALACGVPVVATPVGIVPDIVPPESIEEWDSAALAEKVTNILNDPALYERLRQAGLQAVQPFEQTAAITAYADALKKIAHE